MTRAEYFYSNSKFSLLLFRIEILARGVATGMNHYSQGINRLFHLFIPPAKYIQAGLFVLLSFLFLLPADSYTQERINLAESEILKLGLAELGMLEISSSATLTDTPLKKVPASVTQITKEMIENSGARSLDELLEMFVPSLEIRRHQTVNSAIGMRGNIGGTANRILLLVNDRVLNDKTALGAMNGRYNSMLGDIDYIEVARGPGSAIYGPGAIIGVISIHTLDGKNFEGTDVTVRQGVIENFTNFEFRHSQDLDEFDMDGNIFIYYGVDKYLGADGEYSPARFSSTFGPIKAGENVENIVNDHASYRDKLRHKFHAEYNNDGVNAWIRYVTGGEDFFADRGQILLNGSSLDGTNYGQGYQQLALYGSYEHEINDSLNGKYSLSYDYFDFDQLRPRVTDTVSAFLGREAFNSYGEEELHGKAVFNWEPGSSHSLAFGSEFSIDHLGLEGWGFPRDPARIPTLGITDEDWLVFSHGFFGEYQWQYHEDWTLFLGGRADHHVYTNYLFSPKAALVYTPTDKDVIKLIYNDSLRRATEPELRAAHIAGNSADEEHVTMTELAYSHFFSPDFSIGITGYYSQVERVAFDDAAQSDILIGEANVYGIDAELSYTKNDWLIKASYTYNDLLSFDLTDPTTVQSFSADPYGFGSTQSGLATHNLKIYAKKNIDDQLSIDGSVRAFWGFDGLEDLAQYNEAVANSNSLPRSENGQDSAFNPSMFLNFGSGYQYDKNFKFRLDAIHVLGFIDIDINKRNHLATDLFRDEAPAFAFSVKYEF